MQLRDKAGCILVYACSLFAFPPLLTAVLSMLSYGDVVLVEYERNNLGLIG